GNGGDEKDCLAYCTTCAKDNGCWEDFAYGDSSDVTCWTACYTLCDDTLGATSDLCDCTDHGHCLLGCPGNCSPDGSFKTCNIDCIAN
ncbi:MAG: hypothetical protein V2I33_20115, partial [Kangiellaceae bacterium]|nr:hypothetical protein [Kangiellaceae bacterium]